MGEAEGAAVDEKDTNAVSESFAELADLVQLPSDISPSSQPQL